MQEPRDPPAPPGEDVWQSDEERRESERTDLSWQRHLRAEEADERRGLSASRKLRMVVIAIISALIALLVLQQLQVIG